MRVSRRLLLWLYVVVPFGVGVPLIDALLLDGAVLRALPAVPDQLLLWTLVFNVPHIVASELILLDGEYLRHYRRPLFVGLLLVALWTFLVSQVLSPVWVVWLSAGVTMYHVIGQQTGITRLMGGGDPGLVLWPWRLIATALFLLAQAVTAKAEPAILVLGVTASELAGGLAVALLLCFVWLWWKLREAGARLYLLANQVMFLSFMPLATAGYGFFLVFMPRVVHDLTAFSFYIAHDTNRNRTQPRAYLYRLLHFTGLPPWLILPVVSMAIGYVLTEVDSPELLHPIGMISLFHYFMEAISWRGTGLHRRSVSVG